MNNDIFTPWEGFSQYTQEQIELLRKINENKKNKLFETKKEIKQNLIENITTEDREEDGEYLLWLA